MGNPSNDQFVELRGSFDGSDQFMRGCAVFGNPHSGNGQRATNPPPWAVNEKMLKEVLLRAFPKLETNETQRKRALVWTKIIYLFFRQGRPANRVAMELGCTEKYVENSVRRIRRVAAGLRTTGKPRRGVRGKPSQVLYALGFCEPLPFASIVPGVPGVSGDSIFEL